MIDLFSARPRGRSVLVHRGAAGAAALGLVAGAVLLGSSPVSAEVPASWKEAGRDSFDRTSGSSWGSADAGGAYSLSTSNASASTAGGRGVAALSSGGTFGATLSRISARDVDLSDTVTLDAGSAGSYDVLASWAVRQQEAGSAYTARVRFSSSGKATLAVARKNGSTSTTLASVDLPFPVKAGQAIRGDVQTTGTSPVMVRARAWAAGSTRPWWQIQYSDSSGSRLQGAGTVGVWNHVASSSAPVKILHDDLSVGSAGGGSAVAPPPPSSTNPPPPSATTPPPPQVRATAQGGRGTTLGSAAYPVPAGALFVDASRGSDGNSGTSGSPFRTVGKAASVAPSGETIVLRGGVYHESVAVTTNKTLTIQNYPRETVWFDGSVPLTSWTRSGNTWVSKNWNAEFDSSMGGAAFKARFIGANPMAADSDQVFVNGSRLTQVASGKAVGWGQFSVDDSAGTITVGTDPSGKEVRASDKEFALALAGQRSVVQGIGVRRYATTYQTRSAVKLSNTGSTIRDVVITDNAMMGLSMSNSNKTVDHVVVSNNGMLGIEGSKNDGSVIKNSVVNGNNTENFKDAPVSGGIKIHASRDFTISNLEVKNNQSAGIWFDVSCYDMTVVGNDVRDNRSTQIQLEVSGKGIVANNTAVGGDTGINIFDSSEVKVWNNEVGGSRTFGIKLSQDTRRQAGGGHNEARDPRAPIPDPTVTWVTKNVSLSNNVFGNGGLFQFYALDNQTNRSADSMNITLNGNLFNQRVNKNQSQPTMVAWGQGDNRTLVRYETPNELKAKNGGWMNAQSPGSWRIQDMGGLKSQYAWVALPLPSDVASAAGLPAGSKKLGRY